MNYIESGMDFSPLFEKNSSIYIEKSRFYARIGAGVKTVEFITLTSGKILFFIEAKTSAPNPNNAIDINEYCNEIHEKMQHSLDLFVSREVGVNIDQEVEFPNCFDGECFNEYRIVFLLIVRKHKKEWLSDVREILQRRFMALTKIWKAQIFVWNGEIAKEKQLISKIIE